MGQLYFGQYAWTGEVSDNAIRVGDLGALNEFSCWLVSANSVLLRNTMLKCILS